MRNKRTREIVVIQTVSLEEIVSIIGGGTPSRNDGSYWSGDIPWVSVKDFKGKRITSSQEFITRAGLENSSSRLIEAGTILMPTRMALGKVAINTVPVAINQDIKALKIKDPKRTCVGYLAHYLSSMEEYIASCGKGATVKGITIGILSEIKVPLPSLSEQKRIADILDRAEDLCSKRHDSIKKINKLTQSIFLEMFGDPVTDFIRSAPPNFIKVHQSISCKCTT